METIDINEVKDWWRDRRFKYNQGLFVAGGITLVTYILLSVILMFHNRSDITVVEIASFVVAYAIMMLVANCFYTLGWVIDILFNRNDNPHFRERLFTIGYWLSVCVPVTFVTVAIIASFFVPAL